MIEQCDDEGESGTRHAEADLPMRTWKVERNTARRPSARRRGLRRFGLRWWRQWRRLVEYVLRKDGVDQAQESEFQEIDAAWAAALVDDAARGRVDRTPAEEGARIV